MQNSNLLKVALAQMAPVWLNKDKTIDKIKTYISEAGDKSCDLIVFGEGILPALLQKNPDPMWYRYQD